MTDVPVPINWVHYSLQTIATPPWVWVRSDSYEDVDEPEIRVYTSWEETVKSFIELVEEYALTTEDGRPCLESEVGSLEMGKKGWVFTVGDIEKGNLVIADNLNGGMKFAANDVAIEILEDANNPKSQKDTVTPVTLRELLNVPWDALQYILDPPREENEKEGARQKPECQSIVNVWGSDSEEHDFFIYAYPLT